ncbi:MAG: class I SAM-dependent methyltransferase [Anaerolineales bacterium]|nr:class I SAM-dependent methyltransferase [Anaerolineales bacterium]
MRLRIAFDHFDSIAPIYDLIIPNANIETLIQCGKFPVSGKVLDVGGGTGRVTRQLMRIQPNITIVDSSFGMLKIASQKLQGNLTMGEAELTPFPANTFERVILIDTLHHVADANRTLEECLRVLRKDGWLIIQEPDVEQWGGKLIATLEKLLLMRSHLLPIGSVQSILSPHTAEIVIHRGINQYWILCRK